jgi:hypothetical protein
MTCCLLSAGAQEVSIPDLGLNAAVRQALQKPGGPLTEQDLLSLTNLSAGSRNISSVDGNPLTTLILSEQVAATNSAATVAFLRSQGVSVFTYPLAIRLIGPHGTDPGAFEFALAGPPGIYTLLSSTNLAAWSALGAVTNTLGSILFTDVMAHLSPLKFAERWSKALLRTCYSSHLISRWAARPMSRTAASTKVRNAYNAELPRTSTSSLPLSGGRT